MFSDQGWRTRSTSVWVATVLKHAIQNPGQFVQLDIERVVRRSGQSQPELVSGSIMVCVDPDRPATNLADGQQIIRTTTKGGKRCDIFLSKTEYREFEPAHVVFEE